MSWNLRVPTWPRPNSRPGGPGEINAFDPRRPLVYSRPGRRNSRGAERRKP